MPSTASIRTCWRAALIVSTFLSSVGFAQDVIPAGTIIPVQLKSSISSRSSKTGQRIVATVAQDVPLGSGRKIKIRSKLVGRVLSITPASGGNPARVTFQFDTIRSRKQQLRVQTDLRALASMMDVFQAQIPIFGSDRGTPENTWITELIGGETNFHGGWPVTRGSEVVGHSLIEGGVLAKPIAAYGTPCRGVIDGNDELQAFWVFASDACGIYGYSHLRITHAGRSEPLGQITLTSIRGINIRSGSGLLLRVVASSD